MAAILSSAVGLLIQMTTTVAHDGYTVLLRPESSEEQRVRVARLAGIVLITALAYLAVASLLSPLATVLALATAMVLLLVLRPRAARSWKAQSAARSGADRDVVARGATGKGTGPARISLPAVRIPVGMAAWSPRRRWRLRRPSWRTRIPETGMLPIRRFRVVFMK